MGDSTGMSAADVLALTRSHDNDGLFGGNGILALIIIFVLLFGGNGSFWGNNAPASTALGLADIQASLYNQTQDSNSRALQSGQATITDAVITNGYNNLSQMKDMQYQISNSIAGLSNQIANQTATITNLFNEQTIDRLRDALATTRDELSNTRQTGILTAAINNQTSEILNAQGRYVLNPPCYTGCGCSSLY